MVPLGAGAQLYHRAGWGGLAQFHIVDDRQFRSHQPCTPAGRGGSTVVGEECADRVDPRLTMLGAAQEAWFHAGLDRLSISRSMGPSLFKSMGPRTESVPLA
jgi:alkaline phosphatase D